MFFLVIRRIPKQRGNLFILQWAKDLAVAVNGRDAEEQKSVTKASVCYETEGGSSFAKGGSSVTVSKGS